MKEISDEKIFEYLMTSDFIENYKPSEWKFLLLKFRSFYKNLRGSKERELENKEKEINNIIDDLDLSNYKSPEEIIKSVLKNQHL